MRRVLWILAAAVAVALPFLVPKSFYLQIIASAYITAIAVYGLNVILGYTGLLNLGHAAFFGIGAYAVALLQTKGGWPFWPALLARLFPIAGIGSIKFSQQPRPCEAASQSSRNLAGRGPNAAENGFRYSD